LNRFKDLDFSFFSISIELALFIASHFLIFLFAAELSVPLLALSVIFGIGLLTFGQEMGGHRYFSHDSFNCSKKWRVFFHFLLSIGNFGTALDWRVLHQAHHRYSDSTLDPTSPKHVGAVLLFSNLWKFKFHFSGKQKVTRSIVFSLRNCPNLQELLLARRLSPFILLIYFILLSSLGIVPLLIFFCIPTLFISYSLNSISYFCHDSSTSVAIDRPWINFYSFGGGWHARHHSSPTDPIFHSKSDLVGKLIHFIFSDTEIPKTAAAKFTPSHQQSVNRY